MVVIFAVNSAVAIPKCRSSSIFQTWFMEDVLYPFSARVNQRCVTSSPVYLYLGRNVFKGIIYYYPLEIMFGYFKY